jgi:hypothetical protein
VRLPPRIVACPKCGTRFDADSDVLIFLGLGILLGILLALVLCNPSHAQERKCFVVPFHIVRGMILLDGEINGKRPEGARLRDRIEDRHLIC